MRELWLADNPWCQWPECNRPADEVDHIVPIAEAPHRRYDVTNIQSLCREHHRQKTNEDIKRARGIIT